MPVFVYDVVIDPVSPVVLELFQVDFKRCVRRVEFTVPMQGVSVVALDVTFRK